MDSRLRQQILVLFAAFLAINNLPADTDASTSTNDVNDSSQLSPPLEVSPPLLPMDPLEVDEPGIAGDTIDIGPSYYIKFLQEVRDFEADHGVSFPDDLHRSIDSGQYAPFGDGTLGQAANILKDEQTSAAERMFQMEVFLRSNHDEITPGFLGQTVVDFATDKMLSKARDAAFNFIVPGASKVYGAATDPAGAILGDYKKLFEAAQFFRKREEYRAFYRVVSDRMSETKGADRNAHEQYIVQLQQDMENIRARMTPPSSREESVVDRIKRPTTHWETAVNRIREVSREVGLSRGATDRAIYLLLRTDAYAASLGPGQLQTENEELQAFKKAFLNQLNEKQRQYWAIHAPTAAVQYRTNMDRDTRAIAQRLLLLEGLKIRLDNWQETQIANSILILIDASGSMQGAKLANAKATANRQIARLGPETELAVRAFSGNFISFPFTSMTPEGIAGAQAAVESISASGPTPLAAAIRSAGGYMRRSARGGNLSLIILSDGEETAGGDPPAEVRRLNDMSVQW